MQTQHLLFLLTFLFSSAAIAESKLCNETSKAIPDISLQEIAADLQAPTFITDTGNKSVYLYVTEQSGTIYKIHKTKNKKSIFLDLTDRVKSGGESGLFSLAFSPRYAEDNLFYVSYTKSINGQLTSIISEFKSDKSGQALGNSERILMQVPQPYSNHNGGQINFGPDGMLYIALGDGGSANDPDDNGQDLSTLLGSLLRIDPSPSGTNPYQIPTDNPFLSNPKARPEIWAYGLRNPWRFSFDRQTGSLILADVGQDNFEEINIIQKGGNYGWRITEGQFCNAAISSNCNPEQFDKPVHVVNHPFAFSLTGGYVYRGTEYPELCGVYLFADYVTQRIWGMRLKNNQVSQVRELRSPSLTDKVWSKLGVKNLSISSFGTDSENNLYVADHRRGRILRIVIEN